MWTGSCAIVVHVMNNFLSTFSSRNYRFALLYSGMLLAGVGVAAFAVGEAADKPVKPTITLKQDNKAVNRGTLEMASFSKIAKLVAPSVVKITTETKGRTVQMQQDNPFGNDPFFRQFFGNRAPMYREAPQAGLGSGVIISSDGYIVTNNHVIDKADKVLITFNDGRELKAKVVGRDPKTDVAVVKVEAKDLPAIVFADSAQVEVGDRVLAIGNPFGIGETVTSGIVSAKSRRPGIGLDYEDFIQTDAAINPGNSGGALVDIDGRLIGINTAILSRSGGFQGVGLAIPTHIVKSVANSLVQNGKVVRGYLGVTIQPLTPSIAERLEVTETKGALISEVRPNSPAAKAGLQSGDVITELNGVKIEDSSRVSLTIGQTAPGTKVELTVIRKGKPEKISVTVGTLKAASRVRANADDDSDSAEDDSLSSNDSGDVGVLNGVSVTDIDNNTRRQLDIPTRVRGALINEVDPNSPAARAGLKSGDVILEINHKMVRNAEDAVKLSEDQSSKKTLLKLWSRGSIIFMVVDESAE